MKVVVMGDIYLDVLIETKDEYDRALSLFTQGRYFPRKRDITLGGRASNQATAAARLGADVHLVGCIGVTGSREITKTLKAAGSLNLDGVRIDDYLPTGMCVLYSPDGAKYVGECIGGASDTIGSIELAYLQKVLQPNDIFLITLGTPPHAMLGALRIAKKAGAFTILDPAPTTHFTSELAPLVNLITPNEEELGELTGCVLDRLGVFGGAQALLTLGAESVIVTRGEKGSLYLDSSSGEIWSSPFSVDAIDPLGAGDCFNGSLAYALAKGMDVKEALPFASAASALSTTRRGAQRSMPSLDEVLELLGS